MWPAGEGAPPATPAPTATPTTAAAAPVVAVCRGITPPPGREEGFHHKLGAPRNACCAPALPAAALAAQHRPEPVKGQGFRAGGRLRQEGPHLAGKGGGQGDGRVGGGVEEQHQQLQREQRVGDLLVHQVSDQGQARGRHAGIARRVRALDLQDGPGQHDLADLGQLCVDDGDEGGEDGRVGRGGRHGGQQGAGKQAPPADQVFGEQFGEDVLDVGGVDLRGKGGGRGDGGRVRREERGRCFFFFSLALQGTKKPRSLFSLLSLTLFTSPFRLLRRASQVRR